MFVHAANDLVFLVFCALRATWRESGHDQTSGQVDLPGRARPRRLRQPIPRASSTITAARDMRGQLRVPAMRHATVHRGRVEVTRRRGQS